MNKMDFKFDTLLKEKDLDYHHRWSPHSVSSYENILKQGIMLSIDSSILKNVCYSLQYLEFINFEINQLKLHNIVNKMLYKTFIITSISIIEALFYSILKDNSKIKKSNKRELYRTISNPTNYNNNKLYVESIVYETVELYEIEMSFDSMIKKMEKGCYLDLSHNFFPFLKKFKDLRNRVHIHIAYGNKYETDFWKFEEEDFLFIKYILLNILIDKKIIDDSKYYNGGELLVPKEYEFLLINDSDKKKISEKYRR